MHNEKGTISISLPIGWAFKKILLGIKNSSTYIVVALAFIFSFLGWKYFFDRGLILSYNDSMSHLDIARRVVEGLTPGFAQIGSVWLPLPHILMLPFIWNNFLWHTGLAGTIISSLAYIGSGFFIYRLITLITKDKVSGILGALIFLINPNMIYLQSIPMTESLLLFLLIVSTYYIVAWQTKGSYKYLFLGGLFALFSTLTRYDGWMLLLQIFPVIAIISYQRGGFKKAEGNLLLFGMIAFYGVALWLLWNYLIFNDPLYFATGPFSARTQQLVFETEGRLFSKGNLLYSLGIYIYAVIKNTGVAMFVLSAIGAVVYFLKNKLSHQALAVTLLFSAFLFNVAALYFGHSIINIPELPPHTLFNVRYGIMMLPAVAFFVAYLVRNQRFLQFVVLLVLIVQSFFMFKEDLVITVQDGIYGASAQNMNITGRWLSQNAKDGLILIAASSQDSLIFQSTFPMKRFITEGTDRYWKESLKKPSRYAEYIAMHHGDLVYRALSTNEDFLNNYVKVYDSDFTDVFKRNFRTETPLTINDLP